MGTVWWDNLPTICRDIRISYSKYVRDYPRPLGIYELFPKSYMFRRTNALIIQMTNPFNRDSEKEKIQREVKIPLEAIEHLEMVTLSQQVLVIL